MVHRRAYLQGMEGARFSLMDPRYTYGFSLFPHSSCSLYLVLQRDLARAYFGEQCLQPTLSTWLKLAVSSSVIEDIKSNCENGLDSFAYYYFDFNDIKKQDRRGLLSSLLIQLCTRSHPGYNILLYLYRENGNGLGEPSEVDMIQCLKEVLEHLLHDRVYIVVDAVDESLITGFPSPREKVLELIKELVDLRHPNMRLCITSRPEVDIKKVLKPLARHAFSLHDEGGQRDNIISYIESVVRSDPNMQKWSQEVRQRLIDSLSEKAMGM